MRALIAIVVALAGCVSPDSVQCADGSVCPRDRACHLIADRYQCVSDEQIAACEGRADLAPCSGGTCLDGVCIAPSCGDGRIGPIEVCDDGNVANGDGCSSDCRSDETCGNGIIDLQVGEQCDDGVDGHGLSHDGCSSNCRAEHPEWRILPDYTDIFEAPIGGKTNWAIAYDVARARLVAVGAVKSRLRTMEYDGSVWTDVSPLVGPADRSGFGLAYDARRQRTVMFGGLGFRDTWEWDGAEWSLIQPAIVPSARTNLSLAYDPIGQRVIAFGGRAGLQGMDLELDDTWAWDGVTWTPITTPGPPRRADAAMGFDPVRGVLVLYGGAGPSNTLLGDTWLLEGNTWTRQNVTGPGARQAPTIVFEPTTQRMLLYGGRPSINTTYAWDGTSWTLVATDVPDSGFTRSATLVQDKRVILVASGGMYEWSGSSWTRTLAPLPGEFQYSSAAVAVDTAGRRVLAFGGLRSGVPTSATSMWRGLWGTISTTMPPPARLEAAMAYDEARGEFVLFGGATSNAIIGDTWVFDGAWHERTPATSPPARALSSLVYDPVRGEVVMFGGVGDVGELADVWTWNGSTWTEIPGTGPIARGGHTATYDPIRQEMLVFGGSPAFDLPPLGDTWAWKNGVWTKRADGGPAPRFSTAMAWDPARACVTLFGGNNSESDFNDVWEWDGTTWSQLAATATTPHSSHALVPALDGSGVVRFGLDGLQNHDSSDLRWTAAGREEVCLRGTDFDGDGLGAASCADDPDCWRICTPLCPPGTSCPAVAVGCGDRTCTPDLESCLSCPEDCGACPPTCGDLACSGAETHATCAADCP